MRRPPLGRLLSWGLALAAMVFVVWAVPVRDRCWDPRAPRSTRVAVTHASSGCVLHLTSGDVTIAERDCAALRCEPGIATTLGRARPGALAVLALLYAAATLAWAARWRALLGFASIDLSLLAVWRISTEAQAGGVLLPGGLGGDAFRVAAVAGRQPADGGAKAPVALVVASVLLDRAVGLAVVAAVAAVAGFAWGGMRAGPLAYVLGSLPLAFVAGLASLRLFPVEGLPWLRGPRVAGVVRPILDYLRDPRAPRAIALAALLSIGVALMQYATLRGLVFAIGFEPRSEKWIPLGMAMAFLVGAIPALPGGWGTADAAYLYFFGLAGVPAGGALGVSLLFRLFWYAQAVVGAVLHLTRARRAPVRAETQGGYG